MFLIGCISDKLFCLVCRYGTIPVVRKTGGLNDTVFDVDDDKDRAAAAGMGTNGYSFEGTDPGALDYGLNRYPPSDTLCRELLLRASECAKTATPISLLCCFSSIFRAWYAPL